MSERSVLIVDDSELTRAVLRRYLSEAGLRVVECEDGVQGAVAALRELPSVIVTDLEMPVMDGFQLARLLKNDPATAHIPIVILTSHTEATSRFWGQDSGADAYVTKDEIDEQLIPAVSRLLGRAPARPARSPSISAGPLEVLARVARQLDKGLLEATLINQVLKIGMEHGSFGTAASSLLRFFAKLTDAELLGIGVADERAVRIHLHRPDRCRTSLDLDQVVSFIQAELGAIQLEVSAVQVDGGSVTQPGPLLAVDAAAVLPLPLRDSRSCLAVWAREPGLFEGLPRELLSKATPHAALVLDNVRLAESLWNLSNHDELTGLFNHRAIVTRLNEEVDRASRYQAPLSVVLCDIDRFKSINDTYGHPVGDRVLREVASRMRNCLRSSDMLGRYGGEEFLIVLPSSDLEAARIAAHRLCASLSSQPVARGPSAPPIPVTASFGVACGLEVAGLSFAEGMVSLADNRLYEAKAAGRNCVRP